MKSLRSFFIMLILVVLSGSTYAQYQYIFKTPFPKQIHLLDSVCISLAKLDSQTFYKEIAKLRKAAANTDDYTQLNLQRAILSVKTDEGYELETAVVNGEKVIKKATKMNAPEIAAVQYMTLGFYYELKKQSFGKAFENYLEAYNLLEKLPEEKLPPRQLPNPASYFFTLGLKSLSKEKVKLTVTDIAGRVMEQRTDIPANSTIQLGDNYHPGVYIAQFMQGGDKVTLQLIKEGK